MRRTRLRHTKKYWPTPHYQAQLATSGQNIFFFRDALHLAHPARSSTFFSEKKNEKRHFAMVKPGVKIIRDEISVLSIYEFQKIYSYDTDWPIFSAQDSPEHSTRCAQLSSGQCAHLFGKINYAGPGVLFFLRGSLIPHLRCGGILLYDYMINII